MTGESSLKSIFVRLRVLWLALALLLALDVALRPMVFVDKPSSLAPLQRYAQADRTATPSDEVLLTGSSRFRFVQPERVAEAAAVGQHEPTMRVLAFNGGGYAAEHQVVERYLTPDRLRGTGLFLIGSATGEANDRYHNPVLPALVWTWGDFVAELARNGTGSQTRSFLFASAPARWSALLTAYSRSFMRPAIRGWALRWAGRLGLVLGEPVRDGPGTSPSQAPNRVDLVESVNDVLDSADARSAPQGVTDLSEIPPPTGLFLDYAVGGRQAAALADLVAYLHANGVAAAVVHAPDSAWYRRGYAPGVEQKYIDILRQVGRAGDFPVFVMPARSYGLGEADYFRGDGTYDGYHVVTKEGLDRFSRGIGREIVAPLLREIRAGRRPGFAMSRFEIAP